MAFVIGADSPCAAALRNTIDGGGTWASTIEIAGAWFRDPKNPNVVSGPGRSSSQPCARQTVVARLNAPDCAGVAIWRVGQRAPTSCIIVATLPKDPGQIALSMVTGGGWLSVGDTTMRSTDGLVTWSTS